MHHPRRAGPGLPVRLPRGTHFGAVVITDADGSVLHAAARGRRRCSPGRRAKPFQAVAMLDGRRRPGRRRPGPGRRPRTPVSRCTSSGRWPCCPGPALTEDDLGCPADCRWTRRPGCAVLAAGRAAADLHELLRQARRNADRLRGSGWSRSDYLGPGPPAAAARPDEVVAAVRRDRVGGRHRRLRRPAVRGLAGRAGPGVRRGRNAARPAASSARSPTPCGLTRRWSAGPAGRTPG